MNESTNSSIEEGFGAMKYSGRPINNNTLFHGQLAIFSLVQRSKHYKRTTYRA